MSEPRKKGANWEAWYHALRAANPEAYRQAIEHSEGLSLNYNLSPNAAAEVERSHVMLACSILGVRP